MRSIALSLNPFSLMMEPETVLQAMERSPSLRQLQRHQLRPLDRPLIPFKTDAAGKPLRAAPALDDADLILND